MRKQAGSLPVFRGRDLKSWIGVIIPERDLLGESLRRQLALLLLKLLALGVATLMALYLSRSYSASLQALVEPSSRLQTLRTDVEVESRLSEVRQLAEAQENMRRAMDPFARYVPSKWCASCSTKNSRIVG